MIGAATSFLAIGVADLVAGGLKGVPTGRRRVWGGVFAAASIFLAAGFGLWTPGLVLVALVGLGGVTAWLLIRLASGTGRVRAWSALAILIGHLAIGIGSESLWGHRSIDGLGRWLDGLAFPALNMLEADSLFLIVGLFVFLAATTNGVVRLVLIAAGTQTASSEERLRGGRIIGVLERWLILALMLAGHPTAAGLVVSAKSILRFPELNRAAAQSDPSGAGEARGVDHVTEYFLLGSLVSWLMAVILALLFVGPF